MVRCAVSAHEPLLINILTLLLSPSTDVLGPGSIVDCGAHTGGEACLYANTAPNRTVHAVEPWSRNHGQLRQLSKALPNLKLLHAGLGSSERTVSLHGTHSASMLTHVEKRPPVAQGTPASFTIYRLDSLFADGGPWARERLAFGHFDVEGAELDLLQGATMVMRRDRPIYTVEATLRDVKGVKALLQQVESLGFRAFMVPERCGGDRQCRNFICSPVERQLMGWLPAEMNNVLVEASSFNSSALMSVPVARPSK